MTGAARLAVLLVALWPASLPAQNGAPPDTPAVELNPSAAGGENVPVAVDTKTYEIGSQDVLRVNVWRQPDWTDNHVVRPDGMITLPLVGDVQAAGLTPERLAAQLKEALGQYMEAPEVTVSVLGVNSKWYTVMGLVLRPGRYAMPKPMRVFEALNPAGGFQQWAKTKDIIIIRADSTERYRFNYDDYVKGKNTTQNIYLENGDTIYVHD
jgi:polysaccharide export outer membrane protein